MSNPEGINYMFFQEFISLNWKSNKTADFSRSASRCAPWRVLRLFALYESLAGVIIFIRIAVLAMGLLQYCLYLSVIPPDCGTDCDKGKEAQSENAPHGYGKRNGDIECSESGQQGDEQ